MRVRENESDHETVIFFMPGLNTSRDLELSG